MTQLIIDGHPFPCVVSDVDGVLVDTFPLQFQSFLKVVAQGKTYGSSRKTLAERFKEKYDLEFNQENYLKFQEIASGYTRDVQISRLFALEGDVLATEEIKEIGELKNIEYEKILETGAIPVFQKMVDLIKALDKAQCPLAFVSGSTSAAKVLKSAGLLQYFKVGLFPDEHTPAQADKKRVHICVHPKEIDKAAELGVKTLKTEPFLPKPNKAAYEMGAKLLGFPTHHFLVLEDSSDVATTKYPNEAGRQMHVVYIGPKKLLENAKAQPLRVFETHTECFTSLLQHIQPGKMMTDIFFKKKKPPPEKDSFTDRSISPMKS